MLDTLDMAVSQRKPANVIHHSDQGCQYTSYDFGQHYARAAVFEFIEGWYNPQHRHSGIDCCSTVHRNGTTPLLLKNIFFCLIFLKCL